MSESSANAIRNHYIPLNKPVDFDENLIFKEITFNGHVYKLEEKIASENSVNHKVIDKLTLLLQENPYSILPYLNNPPSSSDLSDSLRIDSSPIGDNFTPPPGTLNKYKQKHLPPFIKEIKNHKQFDFLNMRSLMPTETYQYSQQNYVKPQAIHSETGLTQFSESDFQKLDPLFEEDILNGNNELCAPILQPSDQPAIFNPENLTQKTPTEPLLQQYSPQASNRLNNMNLYQNFIPTKPFNNNTQQIEEIIRANSLRLQEGFQEINSLENKIKQKLCSSCRNPTIINKNGFPIWRLDNNGKATLCNACWTKLVRLKKAEQKKL